MEPRIERIISLIEKRYLVSCEYGFVIQDPEKHLPEPFKCYEELVKDITTLVDKKQLRTRVDQLTVDTSKLDIDQLKKKQLLLLHLVLSFIQMGYVWQDGDGREEVARKLPQCIAVPLCEVSDRLGMKPIISYPSMILANWEMVTKGVHEMQNLRTLYETPGGEGASWFILTHNCIEQKFAPALKILLLAVIYAEEGDIKKLTESLEEIPEVFSKMKRIFTRIEEGVPPRHFYERLRLFYSGWDESSKVLPDGLIYEGVNNNAKVNLKGGSAAQSTTLQVVDAVLGVEHEGDQKKFIIEERDYMLKEHRELINYLQYRSFVRYVVERSEDQNLKDAYDECIQTLKNFRIFHRDWIVKKYILDQQNVGIVNPTLENQGTGGTNLKTFLTGVIDTTTNARINKRE